MQVLGNGSSGAWAASNYGISSGKLEWQCTNERDEDYDEASLYGICTKPITNNNYEYNANFWTVRSYNGQVMQQSTYGMSFGRLAQGSKIKFVLDMDQGVCSMWHNGNAKGPVFTDLKSKGTKFYPLVCFYSSDRSVRFDYIKILSGGSSEGTSNEGGGNAVSYLGDMEPSNVQGTETKQLGTGSMRTEAATAPIVLTSASRGEIVADHGLAVPLPEGAEGESLSRVTYELAKGAGLDIFQATVGLCDPEKRRKKRSGRRGGAGGDEDEDEEGEVGGPAVALAIAGAGVEESKFEDAAGESKEHGDSGGAGGALESKEAEGGEGTEADAEAGTGGVGAGGAAVSKTDAEALATLTFILEGDGKRLWKSRSFVVPVSGQDMPEGSPELDV